MTNREHFIATLQACYCGDRNALEEIIRIYDEKDNIIKEAKRHIEIILEIALDQDSENVNLIDRLKGILKILDKVVENK